MTEKHSPLPWSEDPDDREGKEWNIHILDANGNRVCFMTSDGPAETNAALIVRGVNGLPEAIAALEEIVKVTFPNSKAARIAKAVLTKLKG